MSIIKTYKFLLTLALGNLFCIASYAQYSYSGTLNSTVTVGTVLSLDIIQNNSSTLNFATSDNYSTGIVLKSFATAKIKSNTLWTFSVSSATSNFAASGVYASSTMPSKVLKFSTSIATTYNPLTTSNTTLASGGTGDASSAGNTFDLNLKANPGYTYGPGIYSLTINYTLTAQ